MALGVTVYHIYEFEPEFLVIAVAIADNSYPAGGYPLTPGLFGLNTFAASNVPPNNGTPQPNATGAAAITLTDLSASTGTAGDYGVIDYTTAGTPKLRIFAGGGTERSAGAANGDPFLLEVLGH